MKVEKYAFPGGYPLFYYVESDVGKFHSCPSCINRNRVGKNVTRCDGHINYEDDSLYCEVCNKQIESAYGGQKYCGVCITLMGCGGLKLPAGTQDTKKNDGGSILKLRQ